MRVEGLYAIIDNSLRPSVSNTEIAEKILAGGAKILQLRGKGLSSKELLSQAREIRLLARKAGALFIVNDRADIALLSNADGVHLGQGDLPIAEARKILGKDRVIGISTHNLEQAIKAKYEGADYIGFGPVFGTTTKADAEEAKGLQALREVKKSVNIPVVAIGGINLENIKEVIDTRADCVAVISAIVKADDIKETTRRFQEAYKI
ncbi:MAG: thiamine-phosphate pyrophosphorylase [Deltaproteobacteria bacterium]|nr:thiamine-phosphate pyrophosphorylase [Deltaproteobacteria bacterium]